MTPLFGMFSVSCKTSGSSADASIECSHAWLAYLFFKHGMPKAHFTKTHCENHKAPGGAQHMPIIKIVDG